MGPGDGFVRGAATGAATAGTVTAAAATEGVDATAGAAAVRAAIGGGDDQDRDAAEAVGTAAGATAAA